MHRTQRQQTAELLQSRGINRAIFAARDSIIWLTGFVTPTEGWGSQFFGGPSMIWYEDGHFTLVLLDIFAPEAEYLQHEPDMSVISYPTYSIERPITSGANLATELRKLLKGGGKIGVEQQHVTTLIQSALGDSAELTSIDGWLIPLRMIKTAEEIEKLRYNFRLTDIGHAAARQATQPGKREIDVWMEIQTAVSRKAGQRLAMGNDCAVNTRESNVGGYPLDFMLNPGDSLTVDLGTNVHGYWSDSCMTYYAGEPSARQVEIYNYVREALEYGISLVKPGVPANEIDRKLREFIAKAGYPVYPHHSGHSVGVGAHEEPRIVPYNDTLLQAGMVIMLEPGVYYPGEISVRLEDALLVTPDGAEVLTTHSKAL